MTKPKHLLYGPAMRCALLSLLTFLFLLAGCDEGAPNARRQIREVHVPRVSAIIAEDFTRHRAGIMDAAHRVRRGFLVEDAETRERQMRVALRRIQDPSSPPAQRISTFISSPMSFLAAVDKEGVVIARDADPDHMKGMNFGEDFSIVREALTAGATGVGMAEFQALEEGSPNDFSTIFVAPARHQDEVVGAVVAGIPLWREAQRLSRQLRVELAPEIESGLIVWVYLYKGDRIFHHDTPPDLDEVVPDAAARAAGLAESPGGFTGQIQFYGNWYGYGVVPVPRLGEDVGMIIFRCDAPE